MSNSVITMKKPDYGIDAPGVVRNLAIFGTAGLLLWIAIKLGLWSGIARVHWGANTLRFDFAPMMLGCGGACSAGACWMLWGSKVGKLAERDRLLEQIQWTGSEQVLDVGCGRGLLLIGAAQRLLSGKATGLDRWQSKDLSGNHADATMENARRAGVLDKVAIQTGDMRKMPFPDQHFDVVVSRAAIHNLYQLQERDQAIAEMVRVLKPGGHALIEDIRHGKQYDTAFRRYGCTDIRYANTPLATIACILITLGFLRPVTLVVRKGN